MRFMEVSDQAVEAAFKELAKGTDMTSGDDVKIALREALEAALPYMVFSPLGDNHHNAAACPYCVPDQALRDELKERLG